MLLMSLLPAVPPVCVRENVLPRDSTEIMAASNHSNESESIHILTHLVTLNTTCNLLSSDEISLFKLSRTSLKPSMCPHTKL